MSNSLESIRDREEDLRLIEENLRRGREQSGETQWPFGDMVQASLADVRNLLVRVEELEAALAKREPEADPLRAALIGILRADGYEVVEPGKGRFADTPEGSAMLDRFWDEQKRADAAASDMLGEDEPDVRQRDPAGSGADEEYREAFQSAFTAPSVCINCDQPLPPDGKCRSPYVDCQKAAAAPVVPQADPPTSAETPAAKPRQRTPEPPKLVTEWAPDGRDFEGYAKELPFSAAQVEAMLPDFRAVVQSANPDQRKARWGGVFKDWLKAKATNQA